MARCQGTPGPLLHMASFPRTEWPGELALSVPVFHHCKTPPRQPSFPRLDSSFCPPIPKFELHLRQPVVRHNPERHASTTPSIGLEPLEIHFSDLSRYLDGS